MRKKTCRYFFQIFKLFLNFQDKNITWPADSTSDVLFQSKQDFSCQFIGKGKWQRVFERHKKKREGEWERKRQGKEEMYLLFECPSVNLKHVNKCFKVSINWHNFVTESISWQFMARANVKNYTPSNLKMLHWKNQSNFWICLMKFLQNPSHLRFVKNVTIKIEPFTVFLVQCGLQ